MWKINFDIIFLLVFLVVTISCTKLRGNGSIEFEDSTSFNGSNLKKDFSVQKVNSSVKLFGEIKRNKFAQFIKEYDSKLTSGLNDINNKNESSEYGQGEFRIKSVFSYISPNPNVYETLTNHLTKSFIPRNNENQLSIIVANSDNQYDALCSNSENCYKRHPRSISNPPASNFNVDEYPTTLKTKDLKLGTQKKGRQLNVNSSIDDIINGIMKLLGGNVKIKTADSTTHVKSVTSTVLKSRINNRGPPRLTDIPFGVTDIHGLTRPLIRPPTPTIKEEGVAFVLNTKPPYPVAFPPKLFHPPSKRPYLNGVPIPFNILPEKKEETTSESIKQNQDSSVSVTHSIKTTTDRINNLLPIKEIQTVPILLESSLKQENENQISQSNIKTATLDEIHKSTSDPSPNLTVKFSLATNDKSTIIASSQGMTSVDKTTNSQSASASTFTNNALGGVRATGIVRPTEISPEDMYVYPSIPKRLPDPIRRPYGHRGTVLPDRTFPLNQVITAAAATNKNIFDVTVSAIQGYNIPTRPVLQRPVRPDDPLITSAVKSNDGVFIDGRKTYFDLQPGRRPTQTLGVGIVIPEQTPKVPYFQNRPAKLPTSAIRPTLIKKPVTNIPKHKPTPSHRPTLGPPKRIDTCIVGYDNTCKKELGEVCRTEGDVSSCFCRPGTGRRRSRTKCKKSVVLQLSLKVDKVGDRRISWNGNYANPEAREYQILSYEAEKALDSAFTLTPGINGLYLGSTINKFYSLGGNVIVNSTVQLLRTPQTSSTNIRRSLQRHLIRVIQTNNNYIGKSVLAVEGYLNPIPDVSDLNECFDVTLNDCHSHASCTNIFGSFRCTCYKGYTDRNENDIDESGRLCLSCSRDYCSKRGNCTIENEEKVCACDNSFFGARCEIDGEVISVAVGASVIAVIIILLTLVLLCWKSRQWKAEDRRAQIFSAAGGFFGWRGRNQPEGAYSMNMRTKGGNPAYGAMMEDRIRWSQMAESMAQQNIYAQPEQMRPAVYSEQRKMPPPPSEYGSVGTLAHQQFGMHYLNPPFLPASTAAPNSLSQFTSTSINAASVGGVSRAPTLGARTPQLIRDSGGLHTVGPFGGGLAVKYHRDGMSQDSSEEDDRPYHLPRPKSRGSLAVGVESSRLARSYNSLLF